MNGSLVKNLKAKGCFGSSNIKDLKGNFTVRKTEPLDWKSDVKSGKTWKPKK